MLARPKTLPADTTVGDVRALLSNPSVQMVLLADGESFAGAVTELPEHARDDEPAAGHAQLEPPTLQPDASAEHAFELAAGLPHRRVVVLDDDRNLLGL